MTCVSDVTTVTFHKAFRQFLQRFQQYFSYILAASFIVGENWGFLKNQLFVFHLSHGYGTPPIGKIVYILCLNTFGFLNP